MKLGVCKDIRINGGGVEKGGWTKPSRQKAEAGKVSGLQPHGGGKSYLSAVDFKRQVVEDNSPGVK